jgi:hypothetical protein
VGKHVPKDSDDDSDAQLEGGSAEAMFDFLAKPSKDAADKPLDGKHLPGTSLDPVGDDHDGLSYKVRVVQCMEKMRSWFGSLEVNDPFTALTIEGSYASLKRRTTNPIPEEQTFRLHQYLWYAAAVSLDHCREWKVHPGHVAFTFGLLASWPLA